MPWDPTFWTETLNAISRDVLAWLPNLAGALLLLLAGWIFARLVQTLLSGLLRRLGLDRLAERAGASDLLQRSGLSPSAADVLARLVFWLILLVFLLAATESLGLQGVVTTLSGLIDYLPNVFAAALILLFGGLLAKLVGDAAGALAERSGLEAGGTIGQLVRYALLVFVAILSLQQLGVETTLLTTTTLALIGAAALALAVSFGFGSRDLARNIMAGFHVREEFTVGQRLRVGGHEGQLLHIGNLKSRLETEAGEISVPNSLLAEEVVEVEAEETG